MMPSHDPLIIGTTASTRKVVCSVERAWLLVCGLLLPGLLLLSGCRSIGVKPSELTGLVDSWRASLTGDDSISPRSLQTLRQLSLQELYEKDPVQTFDRLQFKVVEQPTPDLVFTMAELSYQIGQDRERRQNPEAIKYYYFCAGYAYHYLFNRVDGANATINANEAPVEHQQKSYPLNCFDPRFRLACELYNTSLGKCIRAAQKVGSLNPQKSLQLPLPLGGTFTLTVSHHGFAWKAGEFGELLFCNDYLVQGFANHYRTYGLGVPMMSMRMPCKDGMPLAHAMDQQAIPVTAFFRFAGGLKDLVDLRSGQLELYNPLAVQSIEVAGWSIPLETDLTTPLAYSLGHSDLEYIGILAFAQADKLQHRTGIYMTEPYQPGKIPVLFVHGLLSSPITWAPMLNDLMADPQIRDRYQFWFYFYPSGNTYLASAADLRDRLQRLRCLLDPNRNDPALDEMVLVGHSMGGLISKLLTVDSGDRFWQLASRQSLDALPLDAETKNELQQVFYFKPVSQVKAVVFMGTPHQGSAISPSWIGRLIRKLVRLPMNVQSSMMALLQNNPHYQLGDEMGRLPTSIDLLAPGAPALVTLASLPKRDEVRYYSVVGVAPPSDPVSYLTRHLRLSDKLGDGVVPFASAHLPEAESEIVVSADHMTVHQHPQSVQYVKTLLQDHWSRAQQAFHQNVVPALVVTPNGDGRPLKSSREKPVVVPAVP